jgi:hypothetical protein
MQRAISDPLCRGRRRRTPGRNRAGFYALNQSGGATRRTIRVRRDDALGVNPGYSLLWRVATTTCTAQSKKRSVSCRYS